MTSHDRERAYVAAVLDGLDDQLDRARADLTARVNEVREEWSSGVAQQVAASEARIRAMQEDNLSWLRSRYADEAAPPPDVAAGARPADAPAASPGVGHGHRQQPNPDPYAAELAEAERIRTMPMQEWAEVRQTLIRTSDSMFG